MKASIGIAARQLGVSQDTLRRWERAGKIVVERTARGHRRFDLSKLLGKTSLNINSKKLTLAYARVSSHDQKNDLDRQVQVLENFCSANGWVYKLLQAMKQAAENV